MQGISPVDARVENFLVISLPKTWWQRIELLQSRVRNRLQFQVAFFTFVSVNVLHSTLSFF